MDVEHVVVLCLENRSFDHMLGWSNVPGLDGLTGAEHNYADPSDASSRCYHVTRNAKLSITPDPGHELHEVTVQLFGTDSAPSPPAAKNNGFVKSFQDLTGPGNDAGRVMDAFDPSLLPVLHQLAHEFVVCDRWYSAVPGPTWPNRFFLHAASSDGQASNKLLHQYDMKTIYEALEEVGEDWRIYFHDIPQSLALTRLRQSGRESNFLRMNHFFNDAQDGKLPSYSFIEPRYFNVPFNKANDQHSKHDVTHGENLIADIYEALRANSAVWDKVLFVITYDEHGGLYDHVPPPYDGENGVPVPNPDGKVDKKHDFDFRRLGPRVPTLFVSPWVAKGQVDHERYEHSSVPAGLRALFSVAEPLTKRDGTARPAVPHWLDTMRDDTPAKLNRPIRDAAPVDDTPSTRPVNDLQATLVELARQVDPEPPEFDFAVDEMSEDSGARYVTGVMERMTGEESNE